MMRAEPPRYIGLLRYTRGLTEARELSGRWREAAMLPIASGVLIVVLLALGACQAAPAQPAAPASAATAPVPAAAAGAPSGGAAVPAPAAAAPAPAPVSFEIGHLPPAAFQWPSYVALDK